MLPLAVMVPLQLVAQGNEDREQVCRSPCQRKIQVCIGKHRRLLRIRQTTDGHTQILDEGTFATATRGDVGQDGQKRPGLGGVAPKEGTEELNSFAAVGEGAQVQVGHGITSCIETTESEEKSATAQRVLSSAFQ